MITGDHNPSGSNTLDDSFKTLLFVTSEVILGMSELDVKYSVFICLFHCSPVTLTRLLVSAICYLVLDP